MPSEMIFMVILMSLPVVAFLAWVIIKPIRDGKRLENAPEEEFFQEPKTESIGATVLKKGFAEYKGGGKRATYKMAFEVLFLTEEGKEVVYQVPEEIYQKIFEGQSGTLVTVGGHFFDFDE